MTSIQQTQCSIWQALGLGLSLMLPIHAVAQDDIPPPPDDEMSGTEVSEVPDGPGDEGKTPVESEAEASPQQDAASESAQQQDLESDETIYVVENKPYLMGNRIELAPQFVMSVNDRYTNHYGFLVSGMYHLRENVGLELCVGYLFGVASEITNEIREKARLAPQPVDLYNLTWLATADVQWSPIYGKVSVLDFALGHYSLYFSVGSGLTGLRLERYFDAPGTEYELDMPLAFTSTIGAGLRVYFLDWLGARIEFRDYVQANTVDKDYSSVQAYFDVQNYYMIQVGTSFIF